MLLLLVLTTRMKYLLIIALLIHTLTCNAQDLAGHSDAPSHSTPWDIYTKVDVMPKPSDYDPGVSTLKQIYGSRSFFRIFTSQEMK